MGRGSWLVKNVSNRFNADADLGHDDNPCSARLK
jgi:hypothetical protein